jgi:hypothetical protein
VKWQIRRVSDTRPKSDGYGYEFLPTDIGMCMTFYPQSLCWRAGNCSTWPEPDPLPSVFATNIAFPHLDVTWMKVDPIFIADAHCWWRLKSVKTRCSDFPYFFKKPCWQAKAWPVDALATPYITKGPMCWWKRHQHSRLHGRRPLQAPFVSGQCLVELVLASRAAKRNSWLSHGCGCFGPCP